MGRKNHTQLIPGGSAGTQAPQNDANLQPEKFANKTMAEPVGGLHKRNLQQVDSNVHIQDSKLLAENQQKVPNRSGPGGEATEEPRKPSS